MSSTKKRSSKHSSQLTQHTVDVIIVGGGMVGLTFANALILNGFSVAILESSAQTPAWNAEHYEQRVSAITRASQRILENLGVWQNILAMRVSPFQEMQVWDAGGNGQIHFDAADIGQAYLGHIIENSVIQLALQQKIEQLIEQQAQQQTALHWLQGVTPKQLTINDDNVNVSLDNNIHINAKLIVGADGANSWVRQQTKISVHTTDYQQTAIVANVRTERAHLSTAWQRFLPTGPLAFLPLGNGECSIVWSTTPQAAQELLESDDTRFKQQLAEAFNYRLGEIVTSSPRAAFPLYAQHAEHYVTPRLALIGDAAHTIHPLAGQGVNLGFADAATLLEVLNDARQLKRDIGTMRVLRRYERWRKTENLLMLNTMTGFKTLFGSRNPLLTSLRNLGLNLTNNLAPVKNTIMRHAMGLEGDLPKLARPELSKLHSI